jgi:bacillithiol biosynthesis deacetylase BshB1
MVLARDWRNWMPDLDYLVIAPHPDDAELCVGGTIVLLKAEGASVGVLDLTDGEPTPHGSPAIRQQESASATGLLGLDWRGNLGLQNRLLTASLQARGLLAGALRDLRPRVLLAPYWEDAHPDHIAASELVDAARFWAKLTKTELPGEPFYPPRVLYYFSYHLRQSPRPAIVVDITNHIDRKMEVVACYRSQFIEGRPEGFLDEFRGHARYWGSLIGVGYGEPLTSREEIGLKSLRDLT